MPVKIVKPPPYRQLKSCRDNAIVEQMPVKIVKPPPYRQLKSCRDNAI
jgi:hypothetical protein